ncbi:ABC transporter permease [Roseivirga sp. E12]|uniref:ABC transporter permease n=1 Tax=Roseivirga sp. E12 TaxID=2819237 RepID=UPI001ABD0180|nr:ABC transporter permease [Roseivirga sp. E12]MBO3699975.1 ABC transporter permease [Roseivirga sp. E12]
MLKNYFLIVLRTIRKNPGYAGVNILGLTLGITAFLMIVLVVRYELSYDKFHSETEKIFRINNELRLSSGNYKYPTTASAFGPGLLNEMPEVTAFTRLGGAGQQIIIEVETELFKEENHFFADSTFLEFFNFDLLRGNKSEVLDDPNTAVFTESAAMRYFGTRDVIGKEFKVKGGNETNYVVTGLLKDIPQNSHIQFQILLSIETLRNGGNGLNNWNAQGFYTFIRLTDPVHAEKVMTTMLDLRDKNVNKEQQNVVNPDLTPFEDIHLKSNLRNEIVPNGSMDVVYIFSAIAVFVLVIAGINYMNLATARSARRAQEVGIRKVLGAYKKQLVSQFLSESIMLTLIATLLSVGIVALLLGPFGVYINKSLTLDMLLDLEVIGLLGGVLLIIGFGSGIYPALFLSAFRPAIVLKGKLVPGMGSSGFFRKALVVFQFVISIVMMIGTTMVYNQLSFMKNKSLGFRKDNILVVSNTNQAITPQLNTFKNELVNHPNVEAVTATLSKPGGLRPIMFVKSETVIDDEGGLNLAGINIDFDYMSTMEIEIVDGRDFDSQTPTDSTAAIIVNRQAAQELNLEDPVGKMIEVRNFQGQWERKRIIGLIDNINFEPLQRKTESCFYANFLPNYQHLFIKLGEEDASQTIQHVEELWAKFAPAQPFEYSFLDDDLNALYSSEEELSQIIIYFAFLAIGIACLGLFGLASFSTEQRIKEIGVRKVLGATLGQVLFLLSKDFATLIVLAILIASPAAYYLTNLWLQNFAFAVEVTVTTFLVAGLGALVIALLTVSYKTCMAAISNPVKALRSE